MESKYLLVVILSCVYTVSAYTGADLPPGPYCVNQYTGEAECCVSRQDGCSRPILDTLCYCDQFCNRTNSHDDCCPDYGYNCQGIETPPSQLKQATCSHNGRTYLERQTADIDCNTCTCVVDERSNTADWRCSEDQCIMSAAVLTGVRRGFSWVPRNYSQFQGKKLKEGLIYYLGTLPLNENTKAMGPIRYDKDIDYPVEFDSRRRWPGFVSPVVDQGWCGADWAVALTGVASDRFAIQSNGAESMVLSPQTLLSCNERSQQGCKGGNIDVAWNFAKNFGLVDENCFPYKAERTKCPFRPHSLLRRDGCVPSVKQRTARYAMGPVGRLAAENDIMFDILTSGPVFAIMTVHQDFFHYGSGIYRRSHHGDNHLHGLHSVRVVGWGVENGQKYWTVANSWGRQWGEDGYFRIARGSNESGIETFVLTATADVVASQKK